MMWGSRAAFLAAVAAAALVPVQDSSAGSPAQLVVTPTALSFATTVGVAPAPQSVTIGNVGGTALTWTSATDDATITTSPASGSLNGGAQTPMQVSVAAQSTTGSRTSHVVINAGSAGSVTVTLSINVVAAGSPAQLVVTPTVLSFATTVDAAPAPQSVTIGNVGGTALTWTSSADDATITTSPASGSLNGGAQTPMQVSVAAQSTTGSRTNHVVVNAGPAGSVTVNINVGAIPFATFTPELEISTGAVSAAGFDFNVAFSLGPNNTAIFPLRNPVVLTIGTYTVTVPAASFKTITGGPAGYAYQGTINGVQVQARLTEIAPNTYSLRVQATGVVPASANPVPVTLTIGTNSSTTSVTAQIV